MKKIALALTGLLFVGLTACNNSATSKIDSGDNAATAAAETGNEEGMNSEMTPEAVSSENAPSFSFDTEMHDFGQIDEGTKAEYDFVFTNTGNGPLIISNAKGSCGCTVPQWPREPIAAGETGTIHVVFDSTGKPGKQTKQVTLNANTVPNTKVLTITAQVMPKAETAEDEAAKS